MIRCAVLAVAIMLVGAIAGLPQSRREWRHFSPILNSDTRALEARESDSILAAFCETRVRHVQRIGPTCFTQRLGHGFADIVDRTFHPLSVVFGHFLGASSEDAAVSGWSAETHPYRWGGTLLLSKRRGAWTPIWYRSGLITEKCEKAPLPDGREVLLCEDEDSGMGHALHYLYAVDFQHPADLEQSLLAKADTFRDDCVTQKQRLKVLNWRSSRQESSVEIDTTEWERVSNEPYCANYPKRRLSPVYLMFVVTSEGFQKRLINHIPRQ